MLDYIRIACVVPPVQVGNVKKNTEDICRGIAQADGNKTDLAVFPELAITGYTCGDLFFQKNLQESVIAGLRRILQCSSEHPEVTAVVGLPLVIGGQLYNCAAVIGSGVLQGVVPKSYLPDHNEFNEKRWFACGTDLRKGYLDAAELALELEYPVPVGTDILFQLGDGTKLGVEICEDLWVPIAPSANLALSGAEVIVNLAASNETVGKRKERRDMVLHQSASCSCVYAFCSAGAGESTQDLVFSGHSVIAQGGRILAESENRIIEEDLLMTDADLGIVRGDRMRKTSFRDAAACAAADKMRLCGVASPHLRSDGTLYRVAKMPFVPEKESARTACCQSIFGIQVAGLKHRLSAINAKAVIGISGGLDSTLALLVAVEAMRQLGRPVTDVHGVTMPSFGTSDRTYQNALTLMQQLGISVREIPIREAVTIHFRDIGHDSQVHDTTYENSQARERTQILMDYAGKLGGIVVGTGDLSELALGWCTYNGDHMSMYSVNSSVPKTLIPHMIRTIGEMPAYAHVGEVLADIVDTPISPELLPPDPSGRISQQTEDLVGPYALHDFFLYHMLRRGFAPAKIYTLACRAFARDYDAAVIKKWLLVFYRRFFGQQFKRNCQPDGVKVGSVGISPRGDLQMPSDACASLWLEEIETL